MKVVNFGPILYHEMLTQAKWTIENFHEIQMATADRGA